MKTYVLLRNAAIPLWRSAATNGWRMNSEILDEWVMNRRQSSSANAAIGDPSAKRDAADGDHFCESRKRTDGHLAKPDITRRSVDSSQFPLWAPMQRKRDVGWMKNEAGTGTAWAFRSFLGKGQGEKQGKREFT